MTSCGWIECFVSIRFDLDVGPVVEHVAPRGALTTEGMRRIVQVAFPDCNPDCGHEFIFYFTIKDITLTSEGDECGDGHAKPLGGGGETTSPVLRNGSFGAVTPTMLPLMDVPDQKLIGVAHFRQKKDPSVPRGYVQQVVLLLSRLPYFVVHELILRVVAPRFNQCCHLSPDTERSMVSSAMGPKPNALFALDGSFHPAHSSQAEVLDAAYRELSAWPSPHPHVQYCVALLNQSLCFATPPREVRPRRQPRSVPAARSTLLDDRVVVKDSRESECFTQHYIPLHQILGDHLQHLTKLWELMISHQHLLLLSNTPAMSSAAAISVVSLIMPLRFSGDLRPYFTVQDSDFTSLTALGKGKHSAFPSHYSIVASGTNPFFVRSFSGWKNLLSVADPYSNRVANGRGLLASDDGNDDGASSPVTSRQVSTCESPVVHTPLSTTSGNSEWSSLQWGFHNMFQSNFPFVIDHKEQSEILYQRVAHTYKLPTEVLEMLSSGLNGGASPVKGYPLEGLVSGASSNAAAGSGVHQPNIIQPLTLADDIIRKFFTSLTNEFLHPIHFWFDEVVKETEPFQLCCSTALATPLLSPQRFLLYLRDHRKQIAPQVVKSKSSYKSYKALYERFCGGVLFVSHLEQLIEKHVLRELRDFDAEIWAAATPSDEKRVDMFINLHSMALKEWQAVDPDIVALALMTSVLTEMAVRVPAHLQDGLLRKVELLKLA